MKKKKILKTYFEDLKCIRCDTETKHIMIEKWYDCEEIIYKWKCCECEKERLQIIE